MLLIGAAAALGVFAGLLSVPPDRRAHSFVVWRVPDRLVGLRVSAAQEELGLDRAEMASKRVTLQ